MGEPLVPGLEAVAPVTWSLGMPMPGGHIPFSALYLFEDETRGLHVLDPGWSSDENWRTLTEALAALGRQSGDVRSITVTHLHQDHLGMAGRLRAASDAPRLRPLGCRGGVRLGDLRTLDPHALGLAPASVDGRS